MLYNYIKLAYRNLRKQRGFAFINIPGLALGLACCRLIGLWTRDELAFDGFYENADRLHRVQADITFGGADVKLSVTPDPMTSTLVSEYPQILYADTVPYKSYFLKK